MVYEVSTVVTTAVGCYTLVSICSNAVACYQFMAAWSLISRTHRMDLDLLNFSKQKLFRTNQRMEDIDRALYTELYSKVLPTNNSETACPICLHDFEANDMVSCCSLNQKKSNGGNCRHLFHQECIRSWLKKKESCPCCRYEILPLGPLAHPLSR